jgi:hypothetical protein
MVDLRAVPDLELFLSAFATGCVRAQLAVVPRLYGLFDLDRAT